MSAYIQTHYFT